VPVSQDSEFAPRQPPYGDVATYLAHQLSSRTWPYQASVTLHESTEAVADRVDADLTLTSGPPELADAIRSQAARCLHAVQRPKPLVQNG
jgi:hypothetical protein